MFSMHQGVKVNMRLQETKLKKWTLAQSFCLGDQERGKVVRKEKRTKEEDSCSSGMMQCRGLNQSQEPTKMFLGNKKLTLSESITQNRVVTHSSALCIISLTAHLSLSFSFLLIFKIEKPYNSWLSNWEEKLSRSRVSFCVKDKTNQKFTNTSSDSSRCYPFIIFY